MSQERSCRDCRHWGEPPMQLQRDGSWKQGDWHECQLLFVVAAHVWDYPKAGRHFDKGDVVTEGQVNAFDLAVDRLHTGERFRCGGWEPVSAGRGAGKEAA